MKTNDSPAQMRSERMKQWIAVIGASVATGFLLALAMPLFGFSGLAFVCVAPILYATKGQGAFKGILAGLVAAMVGGWVSTLPILSAGVVGEGNVAWNYVGFGLFGLVIAAVCGIAAEVKKWDWVAVLAMSCLAVLLELATFIKMPAQLALTQYSFAPLLALASWTGVWGMSWVVWAANFALANLPKGGLRVASVSTVVSLALGSTFLSQPKRSVNQDGGYGAVQTTKAGVDDVLPVQATLLGFHPRLAVWPELSASRADRAELERFATENWPIVTTMHDEAAPLPHNAAYVFGSTQPDRAYFKRKPFGAESSEIQAGTEPVSVKTLSENVGLNICFDSCYPWIMRDTANLGPDVIALPTLDPASPNGFIQAAHAAFTPIRAAELGVPIVRAEATAWSMVVDADGRILGRLSVGAEGALARQVTSSAHPTFYRWAGDWFLWLCFFSVSAVMASRFKVKKAPRLLSALTS